MPGTLDKFSTLDKPPNDLTVTGGTGINVKSLFSSQNGGRRWGYYAGNSAGAGDGLLAAGLTGAVSQTTAGVNDNTHGRGQRYSTAGASGDNGGQRPNAGFITRQWNPRIKMKFKLGTTSLTRFYFGFTSNTSTEPTGDDELNAKSGVLFYLKSGGTNWQVGVNSGSGATNFTDTGVAADTSIHTIEITAINATPAFSVALDSTVYSNSFTTTIPAATTAMGLLWNIEANTAAVQTLDMYYVEIEQDG